MLSEVLERVAAALAAARIPYMLIGGQAVLVHGEPRLTRDIDITLGVSIDRLTEVVAAAGAAGLKPLVDPEPFARETAPDGLRTLVDALIGLPTSTRSADFGSAIRASDGSAASARTPPSPSRPPSGAGRASAGRG